MPNSSLSVNAWDSPVLSNSIAWPAFAEYLLGLAAVEQRMVILVDIEHLMTHQELGVLDEMPMHSEEVEHV